MRPSAIASRNSRQQPVGLNPIRSALGRTEYGLAPDLAHLFVMDAGEGQAEAPADIFSFEAPRLLWLPPGQGGRVQLEAGARGAHLQLSELGLLRSLPTGPMNIRLREMLRRPLVLPMQEAERASMSRQMETIRSELFAAAPGAEIVVSSLVAVVLVQLWRHAQAQSVTARAVPRSVLERFVLLVAQHRREHWAVEEYASAIGVSRDRLGSAVERATGLSPQAYVHRELLAEARDLLLHSGLQVAEISFRLGFRDPAYFNRFFTRLEGCPPGRFRRQVRNAPSRPDGSFAAWP